MHWCGCIWLPQALQDALVAPVAPPPTEVLPSIGTLGIHQSNIMLVTSRQTVPPSKPFNPSGLSPLKMGAVRRCWTIPLRLIPVFMGCVFVYPSKIWEFTNFHRPISPPHLPLVKIQNSFHIIGVDFAQDGKALWMISIRCVLLVLIEIG